jgi:hypothetical protein
MWDGCPLTSISPEIVRKSEAKLAGLRAVGWGWDMVCRRCGSVQPDNARFCGQCGVPRAAVADPADTTAVLSSAGSPAVPVAVRRSRRRLKVLAGAAAAAVVVLAALAVAGWRAHWPPALFGPAKSQAQTAAATTGAPADAMSVVANLASQNPVKVRNSLVAAYSTQVNAATMAPAGTRIRAQPGTWQQRGIHASLHALVTVPGQRPVTEMVYLIREEGRWRVLFTDAP